MNRPEEFIQIKAAEQYHNSSDCFLSYEGVLAFEPVYETLSKV